MIKRDEQLDNMKRLIEEQIGLKAVRPFNGYGNFRADGYVNMLTKYGTQKDFTEYYQYEAEGPVPDDTLTAFYEGNGLFARIIDTPAEEAIKHGFHLKDIADEETESFMEEALDELDWEEVAMTAVKWTRLFGGAIAVMLIDDGRGLDEPLDWQNIKSVDDIRIYDRSIIQPDYSSMFKYEGYDPYKVRGTRMGMPERYQIMSRFGNFIVHDSRCLVFQNGILPENTTNSLYQLWGMPEYIRINRAIRDAEIAHGSASKMLDRSVQAIYRMKDLAAELATEGGEDRVLKRLQTIDMARGLLNTITIDSEGEDYDFRGLSFAGVSEVVDTTCNFLSALTSIPQTVLFGRSPAGMNATGMSDLEIYYNYVERIQKRMLRKNLRYLLSILFKAGVHTGEIKRVPKINIEFEPLWSLSESEKLGIELQKVQIQAEKANVANTYVSMQAIDPTEVRKELAKDTKFDIDTMLDDYTDEELFPPQPDPNAAGILQGGTAAPQPVTAQPAPNKEQPQQIQDTQYAKAAPEAPENAEGTDKSNEKDPEDREALLTPLTRFSPEDAEVVFIPDDAKEYGNTVTVLYRPKLTEQRYAGSVGVLVVKYGRILCGERRTVDGMGLICGPGGHIEMGETAEQAAIRETREEFGITPSSLIYIGKGSHEEDTGYDPDIFLCTEYTGHFDNADGEMGTMRFMSMQSIVMEEELMFEPFVNGINLFMGWLVSQNLLETPENTSDAAEDSANVKPKKSISVYQED